MMRFCWVKKDGDKTEKIPTRTNNAINALNRNRRTPSERPEVSAGWLGPAFAGAVAEGLFIGRVY